MKTMTKIASLAGILLGLSAAAHAQLNPAPVGSYSAFTNPSIAANSALYSAQLGSLYFASNAELNYNFAGWTTGVPTTPSWNVTGGTIKVIYLGESAGNFNSFGYVRNPTPASIQSAANYTPLVNNIVGNGNIFSGQEAYINYAGTDTIDFYLNNSGNPYYGAGNDANNGGNRSGVWFTFNIAGLDAFVPLGGDTGLSHTKWTTQSVNTWYYDSTNTLVYGAVNTLLVAYEDLNNPVNNNNEAPTPVSGDYTDYVFAFQFLPTQPVPEPSTYGLIGAGALLGLVSYRRFKAAKRA